MSWLDSEKRTPDIVIIIPALNEANSIAKVIGDVPKELAAQILVVNNNSSDDTPEIARRAGAIVIDEFSQGYGFACKRAMDYLAEKSKKPDIVVFLDADYSDFPDEMADLIKPIVERNYDMVIGSRLRGKRKKGVMPPQQVFGNWLATVLIRLFYKFEFTDLGPFRAIIYDKLVSLNVEDRTYGWPVEMQLKAIKHSLRICEVPVSYRRRIGKSKVSGTIRGTVLAGYKIVRTIIKYR